MASPKQTQLLAALEAGNKLHDALREPGMPSKKLLEEWLDNPEFEAEYRAAAQKGKEKREKKTGRPEAEEPATAPRPAVLRGQPSPATQTKARELSQKLTAAIGDGDTYQPASGPSPAGFTPTELQARVLGALAEGRKPTALLKEIPGYNGVKLAAWRKNPEFARRYDVAKGIGANPGKCAPETVVPAEPEPEQPKLLVFGMPSNTPALELPEIEFAPQPEAEPAPNQSEPAPTAREEASASLTQEGSPRKYGWFIEHPGNTNPWLTLEEAQERAKNKAVEIGQEVFVVERICVAEVVAQIRY